MLTKNDVTIRPIIQMVKFLRENGIMQKIPIGKAKCKEIY
jgi:hypothetical protein